jgi:toxin HigB-1
MLEVSLPDSNCADKCNQIGCSRLPADTILLWSKAMIRTFRHKGLAEFFETGSKRKIQAKHAKRLRLILALLDVATRAEQLNAPGLRLHPLKGSLVGYHAVDVDENFRVVFRIEGGHAEEVDYGDYH